MKSMQFFLKQSNVLIISDYYNNNPQAFTEMLGREGYNNIKSIIYNELSLKFLRENIPDIILLDFGIEDNNLFDICKVLKMDDELKKIPTIILTSTNKNIDTRKLFNLGASDFINAPFSKEEVVARVEIYLKLRFMELEFDRLKDKHSKSYNELKKINEGLVKENKILENEVIQKKHQLEEITIELKEFNVILQEEITERTKTEDALKESERQFRYALEEAPLPIMLYTEEGKVIMVNRTWIDITGYTVSEMPTISEWSHISEAFSEDNISIDSSCGFQKRNDKGEFSVKTRYDDIKIWDFHSAYIGELQDEHKLFVILALDITERKHMEELKKSVEKEREQLYEIREYDRIRTEFFSNISHELRTPINVIFSALQMHELKLKDSIFADNNTDRYKYIKIMKQNCYRILRLINNIIDTTKIDSGYLDLNKQKINIINLIESITLSVADYVENKGLSLIFDTDVEEKVIDCDPENIERIILNLLSNAVKFTPSGGKIMVIIEDYTEKISIRVSDTGRGVPKEKLNSIFERFMQVDKSLTRDHEGSGIGLSLVKSLVELHGGTISVKSNVDCGTEFTIFMPCKLSGKTEEEFLLCDSSGENYIEKINIEFSDIYSYCN